MHRNEVFYKRRQLGGKETSFCGRKDVILRFIRLDFVGKDGDGGRG